MPEFSDAAQNYPIGENRLSTRLGKTGQETCNDELTRDCKQGAKEEGNEENTGGAN